MLSELNDYLKSEMLDDYWYDSALLLCEDIINEFSEDEWKELFNIIPKEDIRWNIRLIECVSDINNQHSIECIFKLLSIEDDEIFIACVDALRDKDVSLIPRDIVNEIVNKSKILDEKATLPVKKVLQKFIEKFGDN